MFIFLIVTEYGDASRQSDSSNNSFLMHVFAILG